MRSLVHLAGAFMVASITLGCADSEFPKITNTTVSSVTLEKVAIKSITFSQSGYNLILEPVNGLGYDSVDLMVIAKNVGVVEKEGLNGTYADILGVQSVIERGGQITREFSSQYVTLYVRTPEQRREWGSFLEKLKREFDRSLLSLSPEARDVSPPNSPTR